MSPWGHSLSPLGNSWGCLGLSEARESENAKIIQKPMETIDFRFFGASWGHLGASWGPTPGHIRHRALEAQKKYLEKIKTRGGKGGGANAGGDTAVNAHLDALDQALGREELPGHGGAV